MNDAFTMRRCEGLGDRNPDRKELRRGNRTSMESLLECFSVEILHHDDIVAIKGCDVVNGADVRVVQRRNGPRLMLKTGPRL